MFKGVNKVMRAYIYWDLVINSAWGLLAPVFAIFLLEKIAIGNVAQGARIVGFATFFYWITKSILQIPIGRYLDKNHGEIDDFWFYVIGVLITAFVPFGFLFSSAPWHIYVLQIIHATGMSMVIQANATVFFKSSYMWFSACWQIIRSRLSVHSFIEEGSPQQFCCHGYFQKAVKLLRGSSFRRPVKYARLKP